MCQFLSPLKPVLYNTTPTFSIFMNTGSPFACEIFAHAGVSIITVDCQHGLFTENSALQAFQGIQSANAIPFARSRWNDPAHIMRLLDFGAMGIICPMINTVDDAETFVQACRYSPRGKRSFGPIRSSVTYGAEYHTKADDMVATIAMVETDQSVNNLNSILSVAELDGIFVGPNDLSIDLGHPPLLDNNHAEFDTLITDIATKTNAKGKIAGIFAGSVTGAKKRIEQGYTFIVLANDTMILKQHASKMVNDIENLSSVNIKK